jgi:glucoamylase
MNVVSKFFRGRQTWRLLVVASLIVLPQISSAVSTSIPAGEAPRAGMLAGRWASGVKQIFGTAFESYDNFNKYSQASSTAPISHVWFTGTQGVLSEVFWPTLDTAQIRDSQFLVSDGKSFLFEERKDSKTQVEWVRRGVPAYHVTNSDPKGRFVIERTIFTDPDRDVVLQKIKITKNISGLKFFILHNAAVANTSLGDNALASTGDAPGAGLYAWQGDQAQALIASVPFVKASAGFEGANDGYQDLAHDFKMDDEYQKASNGNVVLTAWLDLGEDVGTSEFVLALGFGKSPEAARQLAQESINAGADAALAKYGDQWDSYQSSVTDLSSASDDNGRLFRASVAVLKSMEDKTYEGAFVACPCTPWGEHTSDQDQAIPAEIQADRPRQNQTSGYHVVWPRDLYQMATTMMAIGDFKSAIASLNRLKAAQYDGRGDAWEFGFRRHSKDGSFPQNFWVNGEVYWPGLQVDETAFPVILAYRLWKDGKVDLKDYWTMVSRAADFIQQFGPWSPQERWEETFGASPSTIASELSALWVAADMAHSMGDEARAQKYNQTADGWAYKPNDNIDSWTFTTTGPHGNGKYYIRIEGASSLDAWWDPNDELEFDLANGAGRYKEKAVTDGGFLELVRYGVKNALDAHILDTLPEYDGTIRVDVEGKYPGFRRYYGDRYNRDDITGVNTAGMMWPLLTGERGHYEIARAAESNLSPVHLDLAVDPYVQAMEAFSTPSLMIPEQVWDAGPGAGQPTGAATPLGWSHGEYIKLLRSRLERRVWDQIPLVVNRTHQLNRMNWGQIQAFDR